MKSLIRIILLIFVFVFVNGNFLWSGQNASAGIRIDFNYTTTGNQGQNSIPPPGTGVVVWLEIHVTEASNLDTYEFDLNYSSSDLTYKAAYADNLFSSEDNILKKHGAGIIGPIIDSNTPGILNFSLTNDTNDPALCPEGDGLLALVKFETNVEAPGNLTFGDVDWYDNAGVKDICTDKGGATLPVELSTFTAQFLNNIPTLYWRTESETDNLGWYVYRNTEEDFTTAEETSEFIEGYGTTTQQQFYIFEDTIDNPVVADTYYYWLESIDLGGVVHHYNKVATLVIPDDYEPPVPPELPLKVGLYQNCPNPFNPSIANTKICFYLEEGTNANIEIKVYNVRGELVKTVWNQYTEFEKRPVPAVWDGCDENGIKQASGIYFYRMQVDGKDKEIKKLLLVK